MHKRDLCLFFIICIICLLVMLPRILSAQFGFLDDGVLLLHAQKSLSDPTSILYEFQGAGRFLPTALLLRMLVFFFAGFEPQRWYIWSMCVLIIICIEMAFMARRYSLNRIQALLSVLFFVLSPTMIENFYTLSKSESPLLLLIASAMLLATAFSSSSNRFMKTLVVILCFLLLLLSFGAKETAIVLPFLFLSWAMLSWIYFKRTGKYQDFVQSDSMLLIGSLIGCVLYWIVRSLLGIGNLSSYSGGYQLFNLEKLLFNFKDLLGWLLRDYPYLLPISLAVLLLKPLRQTKTTFFALRWFSWMGAWSLILLPWNYLSYYLLPFSFGSGLFVGTILGQMLTPLLSEGGSHPEMDIEKNRPIAGTVPKNWLFLLCAISFLLLIPPTANATAYATEQLVFDRANWQLLEQVVKLPKDSQLLVNLPSQEEYFYEIKILVGEVLHRPDISIEAYQPPMALNHQPNIYLANPVFMNQILPRVRGLNGPDVIEWGRCVEDNKDSSRKIFSTRLQRRVLDIGLHRLLVFLHSSDMIGYSDRGIVVKTSIIYGWDLWKLSQPSAKLVYPGIYKDGVFIMQTFSGGFEEIAFGHGNGIPLTGDVNGDGVTDLIIYNKDNGSWMVDDNFDGTADQNFRLSDMLPNDTPLIGDWDGDGKDTLGFFRASDISWHLYNDVSAQATKTFYFGESSDIPIAGDWNGDGIDEIGVYRPKTGYTLLGIDPYDFARDLSFKGLPNAVPVVASWNGDKRDTLAFVQGNTWTIYPFNNKCYPANPLKSFKLEYSGIPFAIDNRTDG